MSASSVSATTANVPLTKVSKEDRKAKVVKKMENELNEFEKTLTVGFQRVRAKLLGIAEGKSKRKRNRPPNGYNLFGQSIRGQIQAENPTALPKEITTKIAEVWRGLDNDRKNEWLQKGKDQVKIVADSGESASAMQDDNDQEEEEDAGDSSSDSGDEHGGDSATAPLQKKRQKLANGTGGAAANVTAMKRKAPAGARKPRTGAHPV
jgi:hypothetical protein